jgi:hypothetical protein
MKVSNASVAGNSREVNEFHEGEAARKWLQAKRSFITSKWKRISLEFHDGGIQWLQDTHGEDQRYRRPPIYVLSFYRSQYRLFGMAEKSEIWFQECDVERIVYRKSTADAFWDACYDIRIVLPSAIIELSYKPPFFGFTPIANARHTERVCVTFSMDYKPLAH